MAKFILGKKLGMTTIYDKDRGAVNITLIECPENEVSLVRTEDRDGYKAVQVTIPSTKNKSFSREFRVDGIESVEKGTKIAVDSFEIGDKVKISGIIKAKGFQGVMKRHGFHGAPATHGHKHDHRAPGSIGSAFPQHVMKGKRMGGRMGGNRSSVKNVEIVFIDKDKKMIGVRGAVPGVAGRIVELMAA